MRDKVKKQISNESFLDVSSSFKRLSPVKNMDGSGAFNMNKINNQFLPNYNSKR